MRTAETSGDAALVVDKELLDGSTQGTKFRLAEKEHLNVHLVDDG